MSVTASTLAFLARATLKSYSTSLERDEADLRHVDAIAPRRRMALQFRIEQKRSLLKILSDPPQGQPPQQERRAVTSEAPNVRSRANAIEQQRLKHLAAERRLLERGESHAFVLKVVAFAVAISFVCVGASDIVRRVKRSSKRD